MNDVREDMIRGIIVVLFYFCQRKYSDVVIPCLVELSINANCEVNLVSRLDVVNAVIEKGAVNSRGELLTSKEVYNCTMNIGEDLQGLGFGGHRCWGHEFWGHGFGATALWPWILGPRIRIK